MVDRTQIRYRSTKPFLPRPNINPTGSNTVYPDIRSQTEGKGMGQGNDTSLRCCIGLCIRLRLERAGRCDRNHSSVRFAQVRRGMFRAKKARRKVG